MVDCRRGTEGDRRLNAISVSEPYDRTYFAEGCGRPYQRDEYWLSWFGRIADRIVREIGPASVLDAGCAMGMLVEALRDRGVEAFGLDVSDFALSQVRDDIKPYCWRGSITDPLPRRYDLILCVEVLEHLQPDDAERAAANLTQHSDDLLFSSTSEDFKEATHVNVREPEYWVEMFARHDFYRDVDYDAAYLAGWAIRLRRRRDPAARQVANYERLITRLRNENRSLRELAGEHRGRIADQERQVDERHRADAPATGVDQIGRRGWIGAIPDQRSGDLWPGELGRIGRHPLGAFAPRRWVGQHLDGGRDGIRVAGLHRDPHPALFDGLPQGVPSGAQEGQPGPEEIEEEAAQG